MTALPLRVACFVSSHGFGHATRMSAIINQICRKDNRAEIMIFSQVPSWFCCANLPRNCNIQVINEVTNFQIKQALNTVSADRAAVDAFVAGSGDQNVIDGWAHAAVFKRDNALFLGAVVYLGWSQEKVDGYIELASTFD